VRHGGRDRPGARRTGGTDPAEHRQAVEAFAAASARGDILALMEVLDPDVVWHSDGGGIVRAGVRPILGADRVARLVAGLVAKWFTPDVATGRAVVNGEPGLVWYRRTTGEVGGVLAFTVAGGRITEAYVVVNPEKLARIPAVEL
ncbi:nuclear transport factor 2 family protein, partial [Kitasatospora sp. NPDC004799]|uniref:nuclear transport factor 2 family protein n=1 Tax=Kitasatospora sp. NPDC004799 TaxID=3154460 RepID=UPI0033A217A7